jgi:hypothetical protein
MEVAMVKGQDLPVQEKKELASKEESTFQLTAEQREDIIAYIFQSTLAHPITADNLR